MQFIFGKLKLFLFLTVLTLFGYKAFASFITPEEYLNFNASPKTVYLEDNGLMYPMASSAGTVEELLRENNIQLNSHDSLVPSKNELLFPGTHIAIRRSVKVTIKADGKTIENYTLQKNIASILEENNIGMNRLDKVSPEQNALPQESTPIVITRINIEEKIIPEEIDFKTNYKSDDTLGWREEKTIQEGIKGIREATYQITYKNGQELSRVPLKKIITKEPMPKIVVRGTHMELGKGDRGAATWYSYKGGMYAASTTLSRGSYARVTNTATGKSIVVQINDYGPFGKGRIIDLDKEAFTKIAPLQAGVTQVKVEEILN